MGQIALVHVWFRALTAHMNKLPGADYDEETVKTYCKRKWGTRIDFIDPITGEIQPALKSLARYDKGEMTAFMNHVAEFAATIGCTLPVYGDYESLRYAA